MFHMCHSNISTLRVALKSAMAAVLVATKRETFDQKVGQFPAVCYQELRNVTYKIRSCKIKKG